MVCVWATHKGKSQQFKLRNIAPCTGFTKSQWQLLSAIARIREKVHVMAYKSRLRRPLECIGYGVVLSYDVRCRKSERESLFVLIGSLMCGWTCIDDIVLFVGAWCVLGFGF
ncbi:hypothetical protein VNO77_24262 [Canavalia gladiata]|uniref:Uncharacterized protein n=1 Tax=Canavalia gladiata TaxID=3824 RepID=A0AAN9QCG2_CANGL